MYKTKSGFTLVELLIVIVVIAILAAITVVAYNGIQDRATNAASQSAFTQVYNLIKAYDTTNSTPLYVGRTCVVESGCYYGGAVPVNSTVRSNLSTIGTLPSGVPVWAAPTYGGILYEYSATRTYNGTITPEVILYYLKGANQDCGREVASTGFSDTMTKSTTKNSGYTSTTTYCAVPL